MGVPLRRGSTSRSTRHGLAAEPDRDLLTEGQTATASSRHSLIKRVAWLAVTAVSLYLVAPALTEVLSSAPRVARLDPVWLASMAALELSSLTTLWLLLGISLHDAPWRAVVTSQLAGNALARVAPGGGATGAALQYRMLVESGGKAATVGSGLAAANVLTFATLLALPVLTVPAIVAGLPMDRGLVRAALLGAGLFVAVAAVGGVLLSSDRALRAAAALVQKMRNRALRRRVPLKDLPQRAVDERNLAVTAIGRRTREAMIAAVLRWLLDYSALLLALAAVGAEPTPALVLVAYAASQLLAMIPITPGGLGFVEAGLTGLLVLAGVDAGDAALAALAYRLVSYWLPLPLGGLALLVHRRSLPIEAEPSEAQRRGASQG